MLSKLVWLKVLALIFAIGMSACTQAPVDKTPPPAAMRAPAPAAAPAATPAQKPYQIVDRTYRPIGDATGFSQTGLASWYGKKFHGKKTANGEIYNMYAMTAAHKTLPLGTVVQVYNTDNQRTIQVRINDRGPFVEGRIIDLSYAAAKKLGVVEHGTVPVRVTTVSGSQTASIPRQTSRSTAPSAGNYQVQAGAFQRPENAREFKEKLPIYKRQVVVAADPSGGKTLYKVKVIGIQSRDEANAYKAHLESKGYRDVFVIANP